ncbi:hypothetical protein [Sagittula stellata]|nr:hypothetical protein [Sagittula stellata]
MRLVLGLCLMACPALAQTGEEAPQYAPLPSFGACMDEEAARYERALKRLNEMPDAQEFEIGDTRGTGYCGSVGFVHCDRKPTLEEVQACQLKLAAEEEALAEKIRAALPPPEEVEGKGGDFEQALYPRAYALAQGISAGPDCDGDIPQRGTWCTAWEANNRLRDAILAWQLARFLGVAETAVAAGWAEAPPPRRPRAREAEDD